MLEVSRSQVIDRLAAFPRVAAASDQGRAAAVAIPLLASSGRARRTVVTRRTPGLSVHPGQWALPGGRVDEGEDLAGAAVRELAEELGLVVSPDEVLGLLDDYVTRSGYRITPVVVWSERPVGDLRPSPAEVASIHIVDLDEIDVDAEYVDDPDLPSPVLRFPFRGRFIHPPTGAFLFQFREVVLHGRSTRVAGFSSPRRLDHPRDVTSP